MRPSRPASRTRKTVASPFEPAWRDHQLLNAGQLPHDVRGWLLDQGSLTERLLRATGGQLRVLRLSQGMARPLRSEARLLGVDHRAQALVRQVVLLCHGEPWVYARSLIPAGSLKGPLRRLHSLGNASLGSMIFAEPSMRRGAFQVALMSGDSLYIHPHCQQAGAAWGRRSHFRVHGRPLLVSEVFLEGFRPWV